MNGAQAKGQRNYASLWKRAAARLRGEVRISNLQISVLEEELALLRGTIRKLESANASMQRQLEAAVLPAFQVQETVTAVKPRTRIMLQNPKAPKQPALAWFSDAGKDIHAHRGIVSGRALCGYKGVQWIRQPEAPAEFGRNICPACWDLVAEPKPSTPVSANGAHVARQLYDGILDGYADQADILELLARVQEEAFTDGLRAAMMTSAVVEGRFIGDSLRTRNEGAQNHCSAQATGALAVTNAIRSRIEQETGLSEGWTPL
jgi:hypothetical protein